MKLNIKTPANCSGPLSECLRRDPNLTEAKWCRGQMRGWAGYWRQHREVAALLGRSSDEIAKTHLSLAKCYRNDALKLEAAR